MITMKKLLAMLLAMVMVISMLTVAAFAQAGDSDEEPDGTDNVTVTDPAEDSNPQTGIALAVLPMVAAAAAVVASKKH